MDQRIQNSFHAKQAFRSLHAFNGCPKKFDVEFIIINADKTQLRPLATAVE